MRSPVYPVQESTAYLEYVSFTLPAALPGTSSYPTTPRGSARDDARNALPVSRDGPARTACHVAGLLYARTPRTDLDAKESTSIELGSVTDVREKASAPPGPGVSMWRGVRGASRGREV